MKKLFAVTPQSSTGSRSKADVEGEGEEEYPGQPIIDEASLRGGVVSRSIGEFGEPPKPAYVVSPSLFSIQTGP